MIWSNQKLMGDLLGKKIDILQFPSSQDSQVKKCETDFRLWRVGVAGNSWLSVR